MDNGDWKLKQISRHFNSLLLFNSTINRSEKGKAFAMLIAIHKWGCTVWVEELLACLLRDISELLKF